MCKSDGVAAPAASKPTPIYVDIHLPVTGEAWGEALRANAFLNAKLKSSEIDFVNKDQPHITLYLTAWTCPAPPAPPSSAASAASAAAASSASSAFPPLSCPEQIASAISSIIYSLGPPQGPCEVQLGEPYAAGSYAMLNVTNTACLQYYSDAIVNATYHLSEPNQTAPQWVHSLPEPERSEKIADVTKYGSPNVFTQFAPHVSVAWSSDTAAVADAVKALAANKTLNSKSTFSGDVVALGMGAVHGTVLKGKDLAEFNVTKRRDTACRNKYGSEPLGGVLAIQTSESVCRVIDDV